MCPLPPQPKPTKGRTCGSTALENVDKALQFLKEQSALGKHGSHDIVDGNHRLTLGLVWTIILRFQVPTRCHLACALPHQSGIPQGHYTHGGAQNLTLGQGTLIIKQDRGQRGCCQTAMAKFPVAWSARGPHLGAQKPKRVLELHLEVGVHSSPQTLLTSFKRAATQLLLMLRGIASPGS